VLRGINLVAGPGGHHGGDRQYWAVGKTTLLNLVTRLFDATAGEVLLDGVDVRRLDPSTLSGLIGLVPQRPTFSPAPVASNLR